AISMLSFPYYGNVLYPNTDKPASTVVVPEYRTEITIPITDMTCASCEAHITHSIYALDGIISAQVDYTHKSAYVTYDTSMVTLKALYTQIKKAGYTPKETP
ncbi:MAG: cation transporter, partial [Fibrobacterales bacterium]